MNYYEICPVSSVQNIDKLTYHSKTSLPIGSFVSISVRSKTTTGIVVTKVNKPAFETVAIERILEENTVPEQLIDLANWISEYYRTTLSQVWRTILPRGIGKNRRAPKATTSSAKQRSHISLNEGQLSAVQSIMGAKTTWLHGTTGSGKTRIYIEAVQKTASKGKDSLVLVPEISLTPQLVNQFEQLSDHARIFVVHSQLTEAQRHLIWKEISSSDEPVVVIGPRSALFSPVRSLGLIVIDEAHESSYHQDQQPKYDALRVASKLREITYSVLALGSATPPVAEFYQAKKNVNVVSLPEKIHTDNSSTIIIDLSKRENFTRHKWLSNELLEQMEKSLQNGNQSLLLLNRRGTRQNVSCSSCGWFAECPNCHVSLRFHHDSHKYLCHTCGYSQKALAACPSCKKPTLDHYGIGTKQLEKDVAQMFPGVRVLRYDKDALNNTSHADIHKKIHEGTFGVIIGTQLIAKGFDLPKLDVVGVVNADNSLHFPDFSANERTFQLLYQVSGRGGRRGQVAHAFIQTRLPSNPIISHAANRVYDAFFKDEIQERKAAQLPPFVFMAVLTCKLKNPDSATEKAKKFAKVLAQTDIKATVYGPTPAFHEYRNGYYYRQLVVKSKSRAELLKIIDILPSSGWTFELDPIDLL